MDFCFIHFSRETLYGFLLSLPLAYIEYIEDWWPKVWKWETWRHLCNMFEHDGYCKDGPSKELRACVLLGWNSSATVSYIQLAKFYLFYLIWKILFVLYCNELSCIGYVVWISVDVCISPRIWKNIHLFCHLLCTLIGLHLTYEGFFSFCL